MASGSTYASRWGASFSKDGLPPHGKRPPRGHELLKLPRLCSGPVGTGRGRSWSDIPGGPLRGRARESAVHGALRSGGRNGERADPLHASELGRHPQLRAPRRRLPRLLGEQPLPGVCTAGRFLRPGERGFGLHLRASNRRIPGLLGAGRICPDDAARGHRLHAGERGLRPRVPPPEGWLDSPAGATPARIGQRRPQAPTSWRSPRAKPTAARSVWMVPWRAGDGTTLARLNRPPETSPKWPRGGVTVARCGWTARSPAGAAMSPARAPHRTALPSCRSPPARRTRARSAATAASPAGEQRGAKREARRAGDPADGQWLQAGERWFLSLLRTPC